MGFLSGVGQKLSSGVHWFGSKAGGTLSTLGSKVSSVAGKVGDLAAKAAPIAAIVAPEVAPIVAGVAAGAKAVQSIAQGAATLGEAIKTKNPEQVLASGRNLVNTVNQQRATFQQRGDY